MEVDLLCAERFPAKEEIEVFQSKLQRVVSETSTASEDSVLPSRSPLDGCLYSDFSSFLGLFCSGEKTAPGFSGVIEKPTILRKTRPPLSPQEPHETKRLRLEVRPKPAPDSPLQEYQLERYIAFTRENYKQTYAEHYPVASITKGVVDKTNRNFRQIVKQCKAADRMMRAVTKGVYGCKGLRVERPGPPSSDELWFELITYRRILRILAYQTRYQYYLMDLSESSQEHVDLSRHIYAMSKQVFHMNSDDLVAADEACDEEPLLIRRSADSGRIVYSFANDVLKITVLRMLSIVYLALVHLCEKVEAFCDNKCDWLMLPVMRYYFPATTPVEKAWKEREYCLFFRHQTAHLLRHEIFPRLVSPAEPVPYFKVLPKESVLVDDNKSKPQ